MNKPILILMLLFFMVSCTDVKKERVKIYNLDDFYAKVKFVDTACTNGVSRAKKDIQNGKVTLNKEELYFLKSFMDNEAINKELQNLGITLDTTSLPSYIDEKTGVPKLFYTGCYQREMRDYVVNKYEHSFLDSIMSIAQKKYILDHPDKIYAMKDLDEYGNKGADDFDKILEKIRLYYTYDFIYPEDYQFDSKKTSETTAQFIVLKDGTLKDISLKSTFKKGANNRFAKYFNDIIRNAIRNEKWTAPYCLGLPVNVKIEIVFKHK